MATISKTLAQRFARIIRSASTAAATAAGDTSGGSFRGFLQKRPIVQPALPTEHRPFLPSGAQLSDRIRALNQTRIRLDGLAPPPPTKPEPDDDGEKETGIKITVAEARKVLRATQMEAVRARLKALPSASVPYSEFVRICNEAAGGAETGLQIAQSLDQSGSVVVLGDTVFLRPELVIKAIEHFIPQPQPSLSDPLRGELKEMEDQKAEIDRQAAAQVRRELWCGLGFLVVQTAAFMRLTFWELSWDVMEPICFYVTSMYFMAGYTFFMRTAKEPSFEGFFQSRFASKQKRLMKTHNFDTKRFNELNKAFGLPELKPPVCSHVTSNTCSPSGFCHCH